MAKFGGSLSPPIKLSGIGYTKYDPVVERKVNDYLAHFETVLGQPFLKEPGPIPVDKIFEYGLSDVVARIKVEYAELQEHVLFSIDVNPDGSAIARANIKHIDNFLKTDQLFRRLRKIYSNEIGYVCLHVSCARNRGVSFRSVVLLGENRQSFGEVVIDIPSTCALEAKGIGSLSTVCGNATVSRMKVEKDNVVISNLDPTLSLYTNSSLSSARYVGHEKRYPLKAWEPRLCEDTSDIKANQFALALLMPETLLVQALNEGFTKKNMPDLFQVPPALLGLRMKQLGLQARHRRVVM